MNKNVCFITNDIQFFEFQSLLSFNIVMLLVVLRGNVLISVIARILSGLE